MSIAGVKFEDIQARLMKDEEFMAEYAKLKPRYELIAQIIDARNQLNITQEELALHVGTQNPTYPVLKAVPTTLRMKDCYLCNRKHL